MAKYGGGNNGGVLIAVAPRMTSGATLPCHTMANVAVEGVERSMIGTASILCSPFRRRRPRDGATSDDMTTNVVDVASERRYDDDDDNARHLGTKGS